MSKLSLLSKTVSILIGAAVSIAVSTPAFAVVNFVPHRAVYDLKMKSSSKRSGVTAVRGRMVVEIEGSACDGWTVNFRLVNDFRLPMGKKRLIDIRSSSWEAGDGSRLTFSEREFVDNRLNQTTRLTASKKAGEVTLKKPKISSFAIPKDSIFPIAHQMRLVAKAKQGVLRDKSTVYDGADHKNIHEAIAFIGQPTAKKMSKDVKGKGVSELIDNVRSWPVSISYYALKTKTQQDTPDQQVSFRLYENGVTGDLVIDYGDFVLKGTLSNLEKLPVSKCSH